MDKTEFFIERARKVHGDKYDYSNVEYINAHTKIKISCKKHGEFFQMPYSHLNGNGCPTCGGVYRYDTNNFVNAANKLHTVKYNYSKSEYVNNKTKVCIICPVHGEFWQTPHMHLKGQGCPKCGNEKNAKKRMLTENKCIELFKKTHGEKYSYEKFKYIGYEAKSIIICPVHGEFLQTPHMHINGNGCPKCKQSHIERQINLLLSNNHIKYEYNIKPKFLNGLEADFYLKDKNIIIECQGIQHIIKNHFFEPLDTVIDRDKRKLDLCFKNGTKIIYILSNVFKKEILNERFNNMYDEALFIEDIEQDNSILLNKISETH